MNITWFIIRGSGIVAFALLSASLLWGLMVSTKVFGRAIKAKGLQWLHESLGLAAVLATIIHIVSLSMDEFIDFSWADILIPGFTDWRPLAAALGGVAFWSLLVVALSFYVKKWIGQNVWRSIHYLSFGTFFAALLHGIFSGTDTGNPWVAGMYLGSTLLVVMLTAIRIISSREPKPRRVPPSGGTAERGTSDAGGTVSPRTRYAKS
jgi:sulfoxide reductase heme-binding subunit YedZ